MSWLFRTRWRWRRWRRWRRSLGDVFQVLGLVVHVAGHFDFEEARQASLPADQPVRVLFPARRRAPARANNKQANKSAVRMPSAASRAEPAVSRIDASALAGAMKKGPGERRDAREKRYFSIHSSALVVRLLARSCSRPIVTRSRDKRRMTKRRRSYQHATYHQSLALWSVKRAFRCQGRRRRTSQ